jgi:hypothetical protein
MAKRRGTPEGLRNTAYHEAAHAVAHCVFGIPFKSVTIEPEDDSLGSVQFEPRGSEDVQRDYLTADGNRLRIEREIVAYYAGPVMHERLTGESYSLSDVDPAARLALAVCGSIEETNAFVAWLWERTEAFIDQPRNWAAIEALAKTLLEHRTLSARKARQIIRDAMARMTEEGFSGDLWPAYQSREGSYKSKSQTQHPQNGGD